jgi:hypothetical protein
VEFKRVNYLRGVSELLSLPLLLGCFDEVLIIVGIMNIRAIQDVMNSQTLEYIFPFSSKFRFNTDISVIVVSEGRKSTFFQVILYLGSALPWFH